MNSIRYQWCNSHGSKAEDTGNNELGMGLHVQLANYKDGKNTKSPVSHGVECGGDVACDHEWCCANAVSVMVRIQIPPVRDRCALEETDKEVNGADKNRRGAEETYNPDVCSNGSNAKEEETNCDLKGASSANIQKFTKPPELSTRPLARCHAVKSRSATQCLERRTSRAI